MQNEIEFSRHTHSRFDDSTLQFPTKTLCVGAILVREILPPFFLLSGKGNYGTKV